MEGMKRECRMEEMGDERERREGGLEANVRTGAKCKNTYHNFDHHAPIPALEAAAAERVHELRHDGSNEEHGHARRRDAQGDERLGGGEHEDPIW